ncbi:MAG TPA: type I-E CRISPR-associated protein Cse2/CasB [Ktedonobacterales bacterium]|nr:type I-E CRISPR-associated protein Cse2/CasB [Ktedonobacterales bacterium]
MSANGNDTTKERGHDTAAWEFVQALKKLVGTREAGAKNLGALAALRRGLGKPPGTVAEMYPYVVQYLPKQAGQRVEDAYFLIAALFAWHQLDWTAGEERKVNRNFGASFRRLALSVDSQSTEKRFVALLDARGEDLPEHLRHAIGLLKSKEIPVDWVQLLEQVSVWDHDNRRVQRAWAGAYWSSSSSNELLRQASSSANRDDNEDANDDL